MGTWIEIKNDSGGSFTSAALIKTGQTTSYRTGDDGDLQNGRLVNFFTLSITNPFGNTKRFTDLVGTQVYADDVVIDWSTDDGTNVLCYDINIYPLDTWDNAIDAALALSTGGLTGWAMCNIHELFNIADFSDFYSFGYAPFSNASVTAIQTSTTTASGSTNCLKLVTQNNQFVADPKGNPAKWMACKYATRAELGL